MTAGVVVCVTVLWLVVGFVVGVIAAAWAALEYVIKPNRELWRGRAVGAMADLIGANERCAAAERERDEYVEALLASAWLAAWRRAMFKWAGYNKGNTGGRLDRHLARAELRAARAARGGDE